MDKLMLGFGPGVREAQMAKEASPLRWHRAVATGYAIVFVIITGWSVWIIFREQAANDFLSFWAAAKLALEGRPWLAYDIHAHRALEQTVANPEGLLPFPYPPPFLLMLLPFGLGSYGLAFAAWLALTATLYLISSRGIAPLPYRMAHPQALANTLTGQNGFLTTGIFMAGSKMLERRPLVGGGILGLLAIKPQLAVLLAVALVAGREWRAIAGAALSSTALLVVALLALGWSSYQGFLDILPGYARAMAEDRWPWNEFASVFALARHLGVPQQPALILHTAVAFAAATLVWRAWSRRTEQRVPVLAAAILLIPPYILTYDALLLMVPMGWLISRERRPLIIAATWLLCLLPVVTYVGFYPGPNPLPIAALLCLWALHADKARQDRRLASWHIAA